MNRLSKLEKLNKISQVKWLSRWAGSYTFVSCSFWGPQYYKSLKDNLGVGFGHTLFIHNAGKVKFLIAEREFKLFGKKMATKAVQDISFVKKICSKLKKNTDVILPLMKKMAMSVPTRKEYQKFISYFERHLAYHNFVKKTVDFLDERNLIKLFPLFDDARKYSEMVYSDSEEMFRKLSKIIAKQTKYSANTLTCLTQKELENFLIHKILPDKKVLSDRYYYSVLYFENGRETILTGTEAKDVDSIISNQAEQKTKQLKGVSAYPGKVSGRVRIILDPHKKQDFNLGDILVTGMTRPEFMSYITKASAIITDVGGVLCHAAITARELKIPCIVGTINATKILKNNQKITINATDGIINI